MRILKFGEQTIKKLIHKQDEQTRNVWHHIWISSLTRFFFLKKRKNLFCYVPSYVIPSHNCKPSSVLIAQPPYPLMVFFYSYTRLQYIGSSYFSPLSPYQSHIQENAAKFIKRPKFSNIMEKILNQENHLTGGNYLNNITSCRIPC